MSRPQTTEGLSKSDAKMQQFKEDQSNRSKRQLAVKEEVKFSETAITFRIGKLPSPHKKYSVLNPKPGLVPDYKPQDRSFTAKKPTRGSIPVVYPHSAAG